MRQRGFSSIQHWQQLMRRFHDLNAHSVLLSGSLIRILPMHRCRREPNAGQSMRQIVDQCSSETCGEPAQSGAPASLVPRAPSEFTPRSLAVLATCMITVMCSAVAIAAFSFSVLMQPLLNDFGWSKAKLSGALSICIAGMAISAPVAGLLVSSYGPRSIAVASTSLAAIALALLGLTRSSDAGAFYVLFALIGLLTPGVIPVVVVVATWFHRNRALAFSALGIGGALSAAALPWVAGQLVHALGWRGCYGALGAGSLLFTLPLLLLFFRPQAIEPAADGSLNAVTLRVSLTTLRAVITSAKFWTLVAASSAGASASAAFQAHAIGMLSEHGFANTVAVGVLSAVGVGTVVAQLVSGAALDRFDSPRVILPFAAVALVAMLVLHLSHTARTVLLAAPLLGLGSGGETSMTSYLITRYFGVANYARIYGVLFPISLLATAPGPVAVGALFDATGSYGWSFIALEAAFALSILFFWLLRPFPRRTPSSLPLDFAAETAP